MHETGGVVGVDIWGGESRKVLASWVRPVVAGRWWWPVVVAGGWGAAAAIFGVGVC